MNDLKCYHRGIKTVKQSEALSKTDFLKRAIAAQTPSQAWHWMVKHVMLLARLLHCNDQINASQGWRRKFRKKGPISKNGTQPSVMGLRPQKMRLKCTPLAIDGYKSGWLRERGGPWTTVDRSKPTNVTEAGQANRSRPNWCARTFTALKSNAAQWTGANQNLMLSPLYKITTAKLSRNKKLQKQIGLHRITYISVSIRRVKPQKESKGCGTYPTINLKQSVIYIYHKIKLTIKDNIFKLYRNNGITWGSGVERNNDFWGEPNIFLYCHFNKFHKGSTGSHEGHVLSPVVTTLYCKIYWPIFCFIISVDITIIPSMTFFEQLNPHRYLLRE